MTTQRHTIKFTQTTFRQSSWYDTKTITSVIRDILSIHLNKIFTLYNVYLFYNQFFKNVVQVYNLDTKQKHIQHATKS